MTNDKALQATREKPRAPDREHWAALMSLKLASGKRPEINSMED